MDVLPWLTRSEISTAIVGVFILCLYCFIFRLWSGGKLKTPPGPRSLPIFGYLPFLGAEPYKDFCNLAKKYGDVFSLYLGTYPVVIIGEYKAAKEVLYNHNLLGRPPYTVFNLIPDELGMITASGPDWQEHRKLTVTVLRYLTAKINKLENTIQDDLLRIIDILENTGGKPIGLRKPLSAHGINNIWFFLFGHKIPHQNPKMKFMLKVLNTMSDYFGFATACGFIPWLAKLFVHLRIAGYDEAVTVLRNANKQIGMEIEVLKKNLDEPDQEQFVSGYLRSMKAKEENNEHTWMTIDRLRGTLQGFFLAGSESTRTSIEWGLCAVVAFPEVQKRIQSEIDNVVGRQRRVQWADRLNMPYTMATLLEIQRWKTLVPISPPRYALEDTTIGGYHIPKGTTVMVNMWAVHNDTNYWKKPGDFRPERFLSEDGKKVIKPNSFLPFSLGRRICPGADFGLTVIFVYLTTILQLFDIRMPEGAKVDIDSYTFGITYQPLEQEMCFLPRDTNISTVDTK